MRVNVSLISLLTRCIVRLAFPHSVQSLFKFERKTVIRLRYESCVCLLEHRHQLSPEAVYCVRIVSDYSLNMEKICNTMERCTTHNCVAYHSVVCEIEVSLSLERPGSLVWLSYDNYQLRAFNVDSPNTHPNTPSISMFDTKIRSLYGIFWAFRTWFCISFVSAHRVMRCRRMGYECDEHVRNMHVGHSGHSLNNNVQHI